MIKKCTIDDIQEITELAFKKNNLPESNSAFCCKGFDSIKSDFQNMIESDLHNVFGYFQDEILKGAIGAYVNDENLMVDIIGPFIDGNEIKSVAIELFNTIKQVYKKEFRYNFVFDSRNKDSLNLMKDLGAKDDGNECILTLQCSDYRNFDSKFAVEEITDNYKNQLIDLHDSIFPDLYVSGSQLIKSLNNTREIFIITDKSNLVAYGVFKPGRNNNKMACIEVLGVDPNYRNKGMGRAVLGRMLDMAFQKRNLESTNLIVDNINVNALGLYRSFGFKLDVENCAYRLK